MLTLHAKSVLEDWAAFAAMITSGIITLLSSVAFIVLLPFFVILPIGLYLSMFHGAESINPFLNLTELWFVIWAFLADLLAVRNIILGLKTMNDPSLQHCAHLFGSSAAILFACPIWWVDIF